MGLALADMQKAPIGAFSAVTEAYVGASLLAKAV
jgi:hypothetical protein